MGPGSRFAAVVGCGLAAALAGSVAAAEETPIERAEPPDKLDALPPAPLRLEQVMRGLLEAAPGRETLDDVMRRAWARNREAAAAAQRREFIRQQTQHFEKMLQPLLDVELAFVKRSCGSLPPEARRRVLVAAREAVHDAAERQVRLQFDQPDGAVEFFDVRKAIHDRVRAAVEPLAAPDEFAAYARESRLRWERREEAVRIRIVAVLDEQLSLSAVQRQALLDDLEAHWQGGWIRELDDHDGLVVNGQPLAPDFADASIVPHLDPEQLRRWRQWSGAASWKSMPRRIDWGELNALNQQGPPGARKPDAWWQP